MPATKTSGINCAPRKQKCIKFLDFRDRQNVIDLLINIRVNYDTSVDHDNSDEINQYEIVVDPEENSGIAYPHDEDQSNYYDVKEADDVDDTNADLCLNSNVNANDNNGIAAVENRDDEETHDTDPANEERVLVA